ncbi:DUF2935 domain-containing protein [Aquibacillus salsiterrae]|uniref:DUF2935 domain-containing protein n=1 Tax=Aquibacillus salsiterrae TaxID=2950439 RepID=A0A9X3WGJ6_9BACI|nr:DUF2935 domain-containing protein [Aquibacillus salsiterrae]MDC3417044.1 DUF2935 domain-containing protein [Aquibacillus salsiterrae]
MSDFIQGASFEHQFWLQVLGDHSRFIRDSLYSKEVDDIKIAKQFIETFDTLYEKATYISNSNAIAFTKEAEAATDRMKVFKLSIIKRHLQGQIGIFLSPTFINHMVNELEEYELVLSYLKQGELPPVFHELHHHLVWLVDASGHAGAINDQLDGVEKRLKERSHQFAEHFDAFYLKAIELTGYLRSNIKTFPALQRFNKDVEVEMNLFRTFLHEIEEMEISETVLGTFSSLMADHMAREECYYLIKLAQSTNSPPPNCNPTKPRTTDPQ